MDQRQRVGYVPYLRTYLGARGSWCGKGRVAEATPPSLPSLPLVSPKCELLPFPGLNLPGGERQTSGPGCRAEYLGNRAGVIGHSQCVRRRMGPPDRALSRIPGVPEDQRALAWEKKWTFPHSGCTTGRRMGPPVQNVRGIHLTAEEALRHSRTLG